MKKVTALFILFFITLTSANCFSQNTSIESFDKAKDLLLKKVYFKNHMKTFYCGSDFDENKQITQNNGYVPRNESIRSKRIEWEHVVAAERFGSNFEEWTNGHPACFDSKGKKFPNRICAEKMNQEYRFMQTDLYNLVPGVGEVNALRSNNYFGMIEGENSLFGGCDFEIDFEKNIAEPPANVRGDIARIHQYMAFAYPKYVILDEQETSMFEEWSNDDPVDEWECKRCRLIESIMDAENPITKNACQQAGLWD